ncbi:MAG: hypothetical protein A2498_03160 [Lentisphaerae bacterium RIFOXYC12_FULL_60_16]|nr:MAG: hypothetical protein A2498_03160 [Lentisphaerae bacterium RIFOXYC12_FULL_60_16]OGV85263.1 MAG: hypothetical protein A2340_01645 [Lentisphaerae bacterium RIFOXYB12_FULL_60_10]
MIIRTGFLVFEGETVLLGFKRAAARGDFATDFLETTGFKTFRLLTLEWTTARVLAPVTFCRLLVFAFTIATPRFACFRP